MNQFFSYTSESQFTAKWDAGRAPLVKKRKTHHGWCLFRKPRWWHGCSYKRRLQSQKHWWQRASQPIMKSGKGLVIKSERLFFPLPLHSERMLVMAVTRMTVHEHSMRRCCSSSARLSIPIGGSAAGKRLPSALRVQRQGKSGRKAPFRIWCHNFRIWDKWMCNCLRNKNTINLRVHTRQSYSL